LFSYIQTMNTLHHHHLPLLLLFLLFTSPAQAQAQAQSPAAFSCDGNNVTNRQIPQNINRLLTTLVSGTIQNGFITASSGRGPAQIYGLAQCRGDVPNNECSACIREAARIVRDSDHCPTQSGARIWYDFCFLRYNTNSFAGQLDTSGWILYNVNNVTDPSAFNEKLGDLMRNISSEAVRPGRRGLGKGTRGLTPLRTLYGLVQCTRDLSELACAQCLATAIFPDVCVNREGCRVLFGSCYVRYELYPFFFPLESGRSTGRGPGSVTVKKVGHLGFGEVKAEDVPEDTVKVNSFHRVFYGTTLIEFSSEDDAANILKQKEPIKRKKLQRHVLRTIKML
ncbi:cysteine-rich repeat secretory protein, partial [Striga asiatica]